MFKQHERLTIISAYRIERSDKENRIRTNNLEKALSKLGIDFTKVKGKYEGITEFSFLCNPVNDYEKTWLKTIAFTLYEQDSILLQESDGSLILEYRDGEKEKLGNRFKRISKESAERVPAWTYVPETDKYFIVV